METTTHKAFNITLERGMEIYAEVITAVAFDGLCDHCGHHPAEGLAPKVVNELPLVDNDKHFALFIFGRIIDDREFWEDDEMQTLKNMGREGMKAAIIKNMKEADTEEAEINPILN